MQFCKLIRLGDENMSTNEQIDSVLAGTHKITAAVKQQKTRCEKRLYLTRLKCEANRQLKNGITNDKQEKYLRTVIECANDLLNTM